VRFHDRPFKCAFSNCSFAEIGFRSNAQLHQHSLDCHGDQIISSSSTTPSVCDPNNFGPKDPDAVLIDAVKADEVDYVRDSCRLIPPEKLDELMRIAAANSTTSMVEMLIARGAKVNPSHFPPLREAAAAGNLDIAQLLLESGANVNAKDDKCDTALSKALRCVNPEMISLLIAYGANAKLRARFNTLKELVNPPTNTEEELKLIECLQLVGKRLKYPEELSDMLSTVMKWSCSTFLASYLIKAGADINSRGSTGNEAPPLYRAANSRTKKAAELMKLLLQSGADPMLEYRGKKPGDLRGAKNISRWLGIMWDELVESTQAERAANASITGDTLVVRQP
jgi:Ankyrin repeats (many copies)